MYLIDRLALTTAALTLSAALLGCSRPNAAFQGQLLDHTGAPVADAIVTIDGIEADAVTNPEGLFVVSEVPDAACALFTATAPGYSNTVGNIDLDRSHSQRLARCIEPGQPRSDLSMARINTPAPALPRPTDVVLLIDRSTSPMRAEADADAILKTQIEIAKQLTGAVQRNGGRIGVVGYGQRVVRLIEPDSDLPAILTALDSIRRADRANWSAGGLITATDMLVAAGDRRFTDPRSGIEGRLDPPKIVVMFSDGAPTLAAPDDPSGSSHERKDRGTTLAAGRYAADRGVAVIGIQIDGGENQDRLRTTLQALQAMTGVQGEVLTVPIDPTCPLKDLLSQPKQQPDLLAWVSRDLARATSVPAYVALR